MAETLLYEVDAPVATITLNRPERLNTIVPPMPEEFRAAVDAAARSRLRLVRPLVRAFHYLIRAEALELAVRRADAPSARGRVN